MLAVELELVALPVSVPLGEVAAPESGVAGVAGVTGSAGGVVPPDGVVMVVDVLVSVLMVAPPVPYLLLTVVEPEVSVVAELPELP